MHTCCVALLVALLACVISAQIHTEYTRLQDCSVCTTRDCLDLQEIMKTTQQKYVCKEETLGDYKLVEDSVTTDSSVVVPPGSMLNTRKIERLNCLCQLESHQARTPRAVQDNGPIAPNAIWSGSVTVDQVSVPQGNVLTIQPGTVITFQNAASKLVVDGWIIALGTEENPITFTSSDGNGAYIGIYHNVTSTIRSVYQHCIFQNAITAIYFIYGASGADIISSTFQYNQVGILANNGYVSVTNVTNSNFYGNSVHGAKFTDHAYLLFTGCNFTNNAVGLELSIVYNDKRELNLITHCKFENNTKEGLYIAQSYANVEYCSVINNGADGMNLFQHFYMTFTNYYNNGPAAMQIFPGNTNVFNLTYNYWGTTNNTYLSQRFAGYYSNPDLGIILFTPYLSSPWPCSSCFITTPPEIPNNYIGNNATWSPQNSPYIFMQDVIVTLGTLLTILPGTIMRFAPEAGLFIDGTLICSGTAAQPVLFTSMNSTATWKGISLRTGDRTGARPEYDYIIVEYALQGFYAPANSPVSFNNSIFRNNAVGYWCYNYGVVILTSTTFYGNILALEVSYYSAATLYNCNVSANVEGFHSAYSSRLSIYNSTVNYHSHYAFTGQFSQVTAYFNEIKGNRPGLVNMVQIATNLNFSFNNMENNFAPPNKLINIPQSVLNYLGNVNYTWDLRYNYFALPDAGCSRDLFFVNSPKISVFVSPALTNPFASQCSFGSLLTPSVNFTCTDTLQYPQTGLRYDACGVCGGDNSSCSSCANQDFNPYSCFSEQRQTYFCASSPLECTTIPDDINNFCPKQCWDGYTTCTSYGYPHSCPPVPRCSIHLSKRCPGGTCVRANESCPDGALLCPAVFTSCPDGSCASTCGPYNGCPLDTPVMCPDGTCKMSKDMCSAMCNNTNVNNSAILYSCWDGQCRSTCPLPPWFDQPIAVDRVVVASDARFPTTYGNYINISFPSSAAYRLNVQPMADSILKTTNWDGKDFAPHLFSTVVNITEHNNGTLSGSIDLAFPNVASKPNTIPCLAILVNKKWTCLVKATVAANNTATASTKTGFGIYAIVEGYNIPTPSPSTSTSATGGNSASGTTGNKKSAAGSLSANIYTLLFSFVMSLFSFCL